MDIRDFLDFHGIPTSDYVLIAIGTPLQVYSLFFLINFQTIEDKRHSQNNIQLSKKEALSFGKKNR